MEITMMIYEVHSVEVVDEVWNMTVQRGGNRGVDDFMHAWCARAGDVGVM